MDAQTSTHATFLARLADGSDGRIWAEFCDRYGELIRGFARRRGLQPADCDDVVQEVLLALTKAMPAFKYDPSKGKFRAYLKTMVIHSILKKSFQKSPAAQLEHLEEATRAADADPGYEEVWEDEWRQYHVRRARQIVDAEFNAADRAAFERYAVKGEELKTVAAELGMSPDQVYQAKSRILRRIGQLVEKQVDEEG